MPFSIDQIFQSHGLSEEEVVYSLTFGTPEIPKDHKTLEWLAEVGSREAQEILSYGYATGEYGIKKDLKRLNQVIEEGWYLSHIMLKFFYSPE
jgi:hypothetical protein